MLGFKWNPVGLTRLPSWAELADQYSKADLLPELTRDPFHHNLIDSLSKPGTVPRSEVCQLGMYGTSSLIPYLAKRSWKLDTGLPHYNAIFGVHRKRLCHK